MLMWQEDNSKVEEWGRENEAWEGAAQPDENHQRLICEGLSLLQGSEKYRRFSRAGHQPKG